MIPGPRRLLAGTPSVTTLEKRTMKLRQTSLLCATVAASAVFGLFDAKPAAACPIEPYLSSICTMATTFCPVGYAVAAGQLVLITDNQALYALIGTAYGGDGRTTFAYPDLRGRSPVGTGQGVALTEVQIAQQRGQESVILTTAQMPRHDHPAAFQAAGASTLAVSVEIPVVAANATTNVPDPTTSLAQSNFKPNPVTATTVNTYSATTPNTTLAPFDATVNGATSGGTVEVGFTGGDPLTGKTTPFPTIPPQIGLTYCIAISGQFPQRS
jgi:microcystin-dependent protein